MLTKLPCDLSCPLWTGYYLIQQATKLNEHISGPKSNRSGLNMTRTEQALKAQISYMKKWPKCRGSPSCYSASSLAACTCGLMRSSTKPPLSSPKGLMDKECPWWQEWRWHMLNHIDFHSPRLTWLQALLCAQPASYRDQDPVWHHSPGWSASYLVVSWLHWTASIMKEQHFSFFSYWKKTLTLDTSLPSLLAVLLPKLLLVVLLKKILFYFLIFFSIYFY